MIGEGRSALQTAARTMIRGGGVICIGRLHVDLRNLNGQIGTCFGNVLVWPAPDSQIQRAANGGSDPSWLNLAFLGRSDFPSRGPKTL